MSIQEGCRRAQTAATGRTSRHLNEILLYTQVLALSPRDLDDRSIAKMQCRYYLYFMTTISLKVPAALDSRLSEEAKRRRTSKSAIVRECVEKMLVSPHEKGAATCLDLAADLVGSLKGPRDIATNPKYLDDFGT